MTPTPTPSGTTAEVDAILQLVEDYGDYRENVREGIHDRDASFVRHSDQESDKVLDAIKARLTALLDERERMRGVVEENDRVIRSAYRYIHRMLPPACQPTLDDLMERIRMNEALAHAVGGKGEATPLPPKDDPYWTRPWPKPRPYGMDTRETP